MTSIVQPDHIRMPRKYHDRNQAGKDALERQRRIRLLIRYQKISSADDIPPHAIPVDPDKTLLAATWSPKVYYEDIHFTCCDCGADECWTADSQMRYFEEKKAGIYNHQRRGAGSGGSPPDPGCHRELGLAGHPPPGLPSRQQRAMAEHHTNGSYNHLQRRRSPLQFNPTSSNKTVRLRKEPK
jgi:hypothetical protein